MDIQQTNKNGDNIISFGGRQRTLDLTGEKALLDILPSNSKVNVIAGGAGEPYNFAIEILNFLKKKNYDVTSVSQAIFTRPVTGTEINPEEDGSYTVRIGQDG